MTLNPTTKYCKICFKEIKNNDISRLFDKDLCICSSCQNEFEPRFITFKIGEHKGMAIYEYTPYIKKLIYQYKGCFDYELNETFINLYYKEIKARFYGYKVIPVPSYYEDDKRRGFNHVIEAFKKLDLEVLPIVEKTAHHKQADCTAKEREEIAKYLVLNNKPNLEKQRVLIVDDIYTTGATIKAVIKLIETLNPKEIKVLVIAKTKTLPKEKHCSKYF